LTRVDPAECPPGVFLALPEDRPDGISLAVKDLFDTAGLVTTYGSPLFAEHRPAATAPAVAALEAGGYGVVGKTNLHEFAFGTTSENPHFGVVPNPLAPDRVAGGSSGGNAAALALGAADVALGTDTAGSVRIPAACCGVVGFKPAYGIVSLDGCFPLAPSFDHVGPMARDVATCERAMTVLADGFAPTVLGSLADVRLGMAWLDEAAPLVRARVREAATAFSDAVELDLPRPDDGRWLQMHEIADVHRELYAENADLYGEDIRLKVERCLHVTDAEAETSRRQRDEYRDRMDEAVAAVDLVLTPTLPTVAPRIGEGAPGDLGVRAALTSNTYAFNALGWPALALPCGEAEHGLPASVQLVGRADADALVLAAGLLLEAELAATRAS
jgi:aspartyl-tRNA(Asn)/glutamyl-tRNA(Gln) amidotransferase subunit A